MINEPFNHTVFGLSVLLAVIGATPALTQTFECKLPPQCGVKGAQFERSRIGLPRTVFYFDVRCENVLGVPVIYSDWVPVPESVYLDQNAPQSIRFTANDTDALECSLNNKRG